MWPWAELARRKVTIASPKILTILFQKKKTLPLILKFRFRTFVPPKAYVFLMWSPRFFLSFSFFTHSGPPMKFVLIPLLIVVHVSHFRCLNKLDPWLACAGYSLTLSPDSIFSVKFVMILYPGENFTCKWPLLS